MTEKEHTEKVISLITNSHSTKEAYKKIVKYCYSVNNTQECCAMILWRKRGLLHLNDTDLHNYLNDSYYIDKKLKSIL